VARAGSKQAAKQAVTGPRSKSRKSPLWPLALRNSSRGTCVRVQIIKKKSRIKLRYPSCICTVALVPAGGDLIPSWW
jgi:hypothetical protein